MERRRRLIFVFTHATVMALFVAACAGQDAFDFLQALGLPAFVALTLPELRLAEAVTNLDGSA